MPPSTTSPRPAAGLEHLHVLLRIGMAACFIGHGAFGILRKEAWLPYFGLVGIGPDAAFLLMPLVGAVDVAVGITLLVRPFRALLVYAAFWCLWTAALRPLAGEGVWELLERAGNYGVPLALLALVGMGASRRGWLQRIEAGAAAPGGLDRAFVVLQWTTALLLVGHGALALGGKPLLASHLTAVGVPASALPVMGIAELGLAAWILLRPHPAVFAAIVGWKLGTEALFPLAGSPFWEFVERGGSYVAPMGAAMIMGAPALGLASLRSRARIASAGMVVVAIGAALASPLSAQTAAVRQAIDAVRAGGVVVVCRHAITGSFREREPVDYGDPSTQRRLSPEGERQAEATGRALRALGVEAGEVLASPMDRARRTAELMFGRAVAVDSAWHTNGGAYDGPARERRLELLATPVAGGVRFVVSHIGTMRSVLPGSRSVEEGDCVVVRPGAGAFEEVGVVPWRAWLEAAAQDPGAGKRTEWIAARISSRTSAWGVRPLSRSESSPRVEAPRSSQRAPTIHSPPSR